MFPGHTPFSPPESTSGSPLESIQASFSGDQEAEDNNISNNSNTRVMNSADEDLWDDMAFLDRIFPTRTSKNYPQLTPPPTEISTSSPGDSASQSLHTLQDDENYIPTANTGNGSSTISHFNVQNEYPQLFEPAVNHQVVHNNFITSHPVPVATPVQSSSTFESLENQAGPSWRFQPQGIQQQGQPSLQGQMEQLHPACVSIVHVQNQNQTSSCFAGGHQPTASLERNFEKPTQPKFGPFKEYYWAPLCDRNGHAIERFQLRVDDVTGVEFGPKENAFFTFRKNQIKLTAKIDLDHPLPPHYVGYGGEWHPINQLKIVVNGVKNHSLDTEVEIVQTVYRSEMKGEQKVRIREKVTPIFQSISPSQIHHGSKDIPLERLHFSKATNNNKNPPNPNQEYFHFVVNLVATTPIGDILIRAVASERMIVKGQSRGIYGTPSSREYKLEIKEFDTAKALAVVRQMNPKTFIYKDKYIEEWGLSSKQQIGFIAEEVELILPEAVLRFGECEEFLSIDQQRIAMECIIATVELSRITSQMQEQMDAYALKLNEIIADGQRKKAASIASGLNNLENTSEERHCTKEHRRSCNFKLWRWVALLSVLAVIAVILFFHVFQQYLLPNPKHLPIYHNRTNTPENMILPIDRLVFLQRDVKPLGPAGLPYHRHSYCCDRKKNSFTQNKVSNRVEIHDKMEHESGSFLQKNHYQIVLPHLNATIDGRFCVWDSCHNKKGKYRLYVPLSQNLSPSSHIIHFTIPKGKTVQACGYVGNQLHQSCDNAKKEKKLQKKIRKLDHSSFELQIDHLLQFAFGFRIGYTTELCSLAKNSHTFDEIIIHFYRKCN